MSKNNEGGGMELSWKLVFVLLGIAVTVAGSSYSFSVEQFEHRMDTMETDQKDIERNLNDLTLLVTKVVTIMESQKNPPEWVERQLKDDAERIRALEGKQ